MPQHPAIPFAPIQPPPEAMTALPGQATQPPGLMYEPPPGFDIGAPAPVIPMPGEQQYPEFGGPMMRGVKSGALNMKALALGFTAMTADLAGAETFQNAMIEGAKRAQQQAGFISRGMIQSPDQVQSGEDFVNYVKFTLGNLVPSVAEVIFAGLVGAGVGFVTGAGVGAAPGAVAGATAGRSAIKLTFKKLLTDEVLDTAEEQIVTNAMRGAAKMGRNTSLAAGYQIGAGDIYLETVEAGDPSPVMAALGAIPYAAAEVAVPLAVAGKVARTPTALMAMRGLTRGQIVKQVGKEAAKNVAKAGVGESATEAFQEELLIQAHGLIDGSYDMMGEDVMRRRMTAAAAGLIGGLALGGVGSSAQAVMAIPTIIDPTAAQEREVEKVINLLSPKQGADLESMRDPEQVGVTAGAAVDADVAAVVAEETAAVAEQEAVMLDQMEAEAVLPAEELAPPGLPSQIPIPPSPGIPAPEVQPVIPAEIEPVAPAVEAEVPVAPVEPEAVIPAEPVIEPADRRIELETMTAPQVKQVAKDLGIPSKQRLSKKAAIDAIIEQEPALEPEVEDAEIIREDERRVQEARLERQRLEAEGREDIQRAEEERVETRIEEEEVAVEPVVEPEPAPPVEPEPVVEPVPAAYKLPKDLSKAAPRYGYRDQNFTLQFESDLDRAAYIVANPKTKSKAHDRIVESTGMAEAELVAHGQKVRDAIKGLAKDAYGTDVKNLTIVDQQVARVAPTPTEVAEEKPQLARIGKAQDADYIAAVKRGDMDEAQRMVDEAARAAGFAVHKYYHGTRAKFDEFDMSMVDPLGKYGKGFYLTNNKRLAQAHSRRGFDDEGAPRVITAYIRPDQEPLTFSSLQRFESYLNTLQKHTDGVESRQDALSYISNLLRVITIGGTKEVIVPAPTQVKSADPVTRDDAGDVIPLSQRFGPSPDIRYAKREDQVGGVPMAEVQAEVDRMTDGIDVPVKVRMSTDELPFEAPADAAAAYWQGEVWLVAENLKDTADVQRKIAHELFAHHGLPQLLGEAAYGKLINEVFTQFGTKNLQDLINRYFPDGNFDPKNAAHRATVGAEKIAEVAESIYDGTATAPAKRLWAKVLAAVRRVLRRIGLDIKISDVELADLVIRSKAYLESNKVITEDGNVLPQFAKKSESEFAAENARLREEDRTAWDKAKKWWIRGFTPGGLLPDKVFDAHIKKTGETRADNYDIARHLAVLDREVKKAYGKRLNKLPESTRNDINEALAGRMPDLLPDNVKEAILPMRRNLDRLSVAVAEIINEQISELQASGAPAEVIEDKITLLKTIVDNMGEYVHRSYQAFTDENWFKKIPDAVIDEARAYLTESYIEAGMPETKAAKTATQVLNRLVKTGTAYDSLSHFIQESKIGAKDLSVLMRRKKIAEPIRALLGEHKDPRLNYAYTASKMSRMVWNHRFLKRVRDIGMGAFLFEKDEAPPDATTPIAAKGSEIYAPLNGLWTYPEINQAFIDMMGTQNTDSFYNTLIRLNSGVKYGKVILSPITQMRNFQSAMFFALANGDLSMDGLRKSISAWRGYVTGLSSEETSKMMRELLELGVLYEGANFGELMDMFKDVQIESMFEGTGPLASLKTLKTFSESMYKYGDDFWKIIGFESRKRALMDTGMSEQDAKVEAAERIRNTYPTYSMLGTLPKALRRFILVGPFIAFPAEIIRTSYHMIRYTAKDWKEGRKEMAARQAVGLAFVSGSMYAAQAITRAMVGIDDEEEEAVRLLAAPWQRNANLAFIGRDDEGNLSYIDLSFIDPYNYWKRPINAILRNQPWEDSATDMMIEMLNPFLSPDIAAGAMLEVVSNKKMATGANVFNEFGTPVEQTLEIADHLRKNLQPGVASSLERTWKAIDGQYSPSGKKYDLFDEGLGWVGWRASTLDPKVSLYYRTFDFSEAKRAASKSLNRVLRGTKDVSDEDLRDALESATRQNDEAYRSLRLIIKAAEANNVSRPQIYQILKRSRISKRDIRLLIRGGTPRLNITTKAQVEAVKKARALRDPEAAKEISRRYLSAKRMITESP